MIVHTCFNNTSLHGYSSNVLKSGICKYYRRSESEKFKWCVMEMSLFNDHPKGGVLITNLVNRLKILLMEDMSSGEIFRIHKGIELLENYDNNRDKQHLLLEFCDLVIESKKNRIVSYINCWWRNKTYTKNDIVLNKVLKYKKDNDTHELLELGEHLIERIENNQENIFEIFNEMMKIKTNCGLRYRRKEASYLWYEIIYDYINHSNELKTIFDFSLQMFMRKGMKERPAFAIWLGVILWKKDRLDYSNKEYINYSYDDFLSYKESMKKIEMDDYVVEDYHVNKGFGLGKFAEIGAFVKDEDLSLIDNDHKYKEFYICDKQKNDISKNKKKNKKKSKINFNMNSLERINWNEFNNIKVLEEGVCGGKVCCISVSYRNNRYILKEMGESMNYGADYIIADKCKEYFDLWSMNMKRIVSNQKLIKKDIKGKSFVNNWKFSEEDAVYCMMEYFENIGDLGKNKNYLNDSNIVRECLKIRLFDGLFRSSDNILRNILVNKEGELLSIDEGDLFGKREKVFNINDWCCSKNISESIMKDVLKDIIFNRDNKYNKIINIMKEYNFYHHIQEFKDRFYNYEKIILDEWK